MQQEREKYLDLEELSKYLMDNPSKHTIYQWTKEKRVPFIKLGKKIFFEKTKIDEWNSNGREM